MGARGVSKNPQVCEFGPFGLPLSSVENSRPPKKIPALEHPDLKHIVSRQDADIGGERPESGRRGIGSSSRSRRSVRAAAGRRMARCCGSV